MTIVEIKQLSNGAHRNQIGVNFCPDGWAILPSTIEIQNFPFGNIQTELIDGIQTITSWEPLQIPEPVEPEVISTEDILSEMVIDHEYRLALLEGGTE